VEEHVEETIAGGTWLFLSTIVVALMGFIFWFLVARLAGAKVLGITSAIVSSAGIATTLASAGMNLAVVREVAAKGSSAFTSSMALASALALIAGAVSVPLVKGIGYGSLVALAFIMAFLSVLYIPLSSALLGVEEFRGYFLVVLLASTAKLAVGLGLVYMGLKLLGPILGYLSFPLAGILASLPLVLLRLKPKFNSFNLKAFKDVASLTLSNYPFAVSGALMTSLSVYIFAYLVREAVPTGILYVSLMIVLVISAIPGSMLNAALPIGTRRSSDPFSEDLRLGLSLALPIAALVMAAPRLTLKLMNPSLVSGSTALRILALSIVPISVVGAVIRRLNKEGRRKEIAALGGILLASLLVLIVPLTRRFGIEGASIAYLLAYTVPLPLALKLMPEAIKSSIELWMAYALIDLIAYLVPLNELVMAPLLFIVSIALVHASKVATLNEMVGAIKIALRAVLGYKPIKDD
jgi:O-antigen/teichoic acid export membrane protein